MNAEQQHDNVNAKYLRAQALAAIRHRRNGVASFLAVCARFRRYSLSNVLLIYAQRPYARIVASRETWESLGRQVRLGEAGIFIRAPIVSRQRGEPERRRVEVFEWRVVFDIGQTEGRELPTLTERTTQEYLDALRRFARANKLADTRAAKGEEPDEQLVRLILSVSGELAKRTSPSVLDQILDAEAVDFVVMHAIGLRPRGDQLVKAARMDESDLSDSLKRVHSMSRMILRGIKPDPKNRVGAEGSSTLPSAPSGAEVTTS